MSFLTMLVGLAATEGQRMVIPPVSHPIWQQLLSGRIDWRLESLPVKIFLGSAKLQLTRRSSIDSRRNCAIYL